MDNKNVTEYVTAVHSSPQGLDHEVIRLIGEGYFPFGSPYASPDSYCQAMVKYSNR
jgi:hypothetical protein